MEAFEEVPVSQMRKTIAKRLGESKFTAPHFYLTIEMDMERAMQVREAINEQHRAGQDLLQRPRDQGGGRGLEEAPQGEQQLAR